MLPGDFSNRSKTHLLPDASDCRGGGCSCELLPGFEGCPGPGPGASLCWLAAEAAPASAAGAGFKFFVRNWPKP